MEYKLDALTVVALGDSRSAVSFGNAAGNRKSDTEAPCSGTARFVLPVKAVEQL